MREEAKQLLSDYPNFTVVVDRLSNDEHRKFIDLIRVITWATSPSKAAACQDLSDLMKAAAERQADLAITARQLISRAYHQSAYQD